MRRLVRSLIGRILTVITVMPEGQLVDVQISISALLLHSLTRMSISSAVGMQMRRRDQSLQKQLELTRAVHKTMAKRSSSMLIFFFFLYFFSKISQSVRARAPSI